MVPRNISSSAAVGRVVQDLPYRADPMQDTCVAVDHGDLTIPPDKMKELDHNRSRIALA